jgi:hypothetical protein
MVSVCSSPVFRPRFGDGRNYIAAANSLIEGRGYPRVNEERPFFRAPLYPFVIAGLWAFAPASPLTIKLAQVVLFCITCLLARYAGALVTGRADLGLWSGLMAGTNPFLVDQVGRVQTETLHALLVMVSLLALYRGLLSRARAWAFFGASGVGWGLAALCRPTALPIAILLCVAVYALRLERRIGPLLAFACGLVASIAPWTVANFRATGEWIVITDGSGYHLWLGNRPENVELLTGRFESVPEFGLEANQHLQVIVPRALMSSWEHSSGYRAHSFTERDRMWRREAVSEMWSHPSRTALLWLLKAWAYWRPWLNTGAYAGSLVLASAAYLCLLYGAAYRGAGLLWSRSAGRAWVLLTVILFVASTLIHVVVHSMMRFRLPYVDPILCILAGVSLGTFVRTWVGRHGADGAAPETALGSQRNSMVETVR